MFKKFLVPSVMGCSLLVSACSDDVKKVGDNTGGATVYDVSDISGTWDLMGSVSTTGKSVTGTLTIGRDVFMLELGTVLVFYSPRDMPGLQVSVRTNDVDPGEVGPGTPDVTNYDVTHEASAQIDLGVIPNQVGGFWDAVGTNYDRCVADVERGMIAGACVPIGFEGGGGGWFRAELLEQSPSIFGDLGGIWNVQNGYGVTGGCTAILRDTTLTARCSGTGSRTDGQITFTMQDGFGTGSSDLGLEISAVRR